MIIQLKAFFFILLTIVLPGISIQASEVSDLYAAEAYEMKERGDYDSAIVLYEQALKIDPTVPAYYLDLGYIYFFQNNYDLALKYYDLGLKVGHDTKYGPRLFLEKHKVSQILEEISKREAQTQNIDELSEFHQQRLAFVDSDVASIIELYESKLFENEFVMQDDYSCRERGNYRRIIFRNFVHKIEILDIDSLVKNGMPEWLGRRNCEIELNFSDEDIIVGASMHIEDTFDQCFGGIYKCCAFWPAPYVSGDINYEEWYEKIGSAVQGKIVRVSDIRRITLENPSRIFGREFEIRRKVSKDENYSYFYYDIGIENSDESTVRAISLPDMKIVQGCR